MSFFVRDLRGSCELNRFSGNKDAKCVPKAVVASYVGESLRDSLNPGLGETGLRESEPRISPRFDNAKILTTAEC